MRFKIRASACSHITGGSVGLTDTQQTELDKLKSKRKDKGFNSLTHKQLETFINISYKRDCPELPQGAKTYCKDWLKGQVLERQRMIHSKHTAKGHLTEDGSIDFVAQQLGYGMLFKNEDYFENDFMKGTPDVILKDHIIDVKNSWDTHTFPFFEAEIPNMDYYWQGQVYMELTNRRKYKLIYILSDAPEHLIEREFYSYCRLYDLEPEEDIYNEFVDRLTYSDIPDKYKIKVFEFGYNEQHVKEIYKRVEMCRDYIIELYKMVPK